MPARDRRSAFFILLAITLVVLAAPYIYAYCNTPSGKYCTSVLQPAGAEVCDANFYISWGPVQAAEKHFLFEDKLNGYTNQRLVFNAYWLVTGYIAGLLKADTYLFNHIQRLIASSILCLIIFNFLAVFFTDKKYHILAFILVLYSGYNLDAYPEGDIFQSMLWEVILPAGYCFFLITIYYCYKTAFISPANVWKAAVASLIMGTVYPYATVSVCFIMFNTFAFLVLTKKMELLQAVKNYAIIFLFTIPIVLYDYYIVLTDKRYIEGIATFTSGPLYMFLPAYGLLLAAALAGIYIAYKQKNTLMYFPGIWMVSTFIQIYFPIQIIPFQIQLILGVQVPMVILAVYALNYLFNNISWLKSIQVQGVFVSLFFLSVVVSNAMVYARIVQMISANIMPVYLEKDVVQGLKWLKANAKEEDVVISTPIISSYIPVISGTRIYSSDYWAPTPDFPQKVKKIDWLFDAKAEKSDSSVLSFLKENKISYVLENNYNSRRNLPLNSSSFAHCNGLKLDFENKYIRIYSTKSSI